MGYLITDDLHEDAFFTESVELTIENLLPRAKIELALGHSHNDLAAHDCALEVGVSVVLAAIVRVLGMGMLGGELFQPLFKIPVKARFIVVDEDAGRNVHRIDEAESLADAALAHAGFDLCGYVHKRAPPGNFEPEFLSVRFHFAEGLHLRDAVIEIFSVKAGLAKEG